MGAVENLAARLADLGGPTDPARADARASTNNLMDTLASWLAPLASVGTVTVRREADPFRRPEGVGGVSEVVFAPLAIPVLVIFVPLLPPVGESVSKVVVVADRILFDIIRFGQDWFVDLAALGKPRLTPDTLGKALSLTLLPRLA